VSQLLAIHKSSEVMHSLPAHVLGIRKSINGGASVGHRQVSAENRSQAQPPFEAGTGEDGAEVSPSEPVDGLIPSTEEGLDSAMKELALEVRCGPSFVWIIWTRSVGHLAYWLSWSQHALYIAFLKHCCCRCTVVRGGVLPGRLYQNALKGLKLGKAKVSKLGNTQVGQVL